MNLLKERAIKIIEILKETYSDVRIALDFNSPFELLIATILSAQCTDSRVNIVTKDLFMVYKSSEDFIHASLCDIEKIIYSTGFYKQKAKTIKKCSAYLLENFGGEVPKDFDKLVKIPGVGRKTASVIVGNAFNIPAIAVDTHVIRITKILGFVSTKNPEKIENILKSIIPKKDWIILSHLIATHGRQICIARNPRCIICCIALHCPSKNL